MISRRAYSAFALACCALNNGSGAEYVGPETTPGQAPAVVTAAPVPSPTDHLRSVPRNAYESTPAAGIPMRSIFRHTSAPYYDSLRDWTLSPSIRVADSVTVTTDIDLPDFRGSFPLLQRGFAPEEADLKIGPVYFKLRHVSGAVLLSDNVDHSEDNRERDILGIFSVGGQILAQLSEGFQIAAAGNFVYLPFEREHGIEGFSLRAPYSFGIAATPTSRAQVVWQPVFFGWPFTIADEFRIGMARFANGAYDGFAFFDGYDFDEYDRAGVYTLRGRNFPTGDEFRDRGFDEDTEFTYLSNEVSVATGGAVPGQALLRFRASHEDLWYIDEGERFNLPTIRDRAILSIESVRENLRFKPYARYEFFRRNEPETRNHKGLVGIKGPATDLIFFRGELGVLWRTEQDARDLIWRIGLYHTPNPHTWHSLEYFRDTADFGDELEQRIIYRITKTLGPELRGSAYASYGWVEDAFGSEFDRSEWRSGLRLTYLASPKTTFRVAAQHARIDYADEPSLTEAWRVRAEAHHRFLERLSARAIYQFQRREADRRSGSYYENLLYFSLSWLFD